MFIELTDIANKEGINICQVNINKIISYARYDESATVIKFEGGGYIITSESFEQVKALIEQRERSKILNDINMERQRQDHLHPQYLNLNARFVTIMEEAGEVAEALQDNDMAAVYRELIDTAACCVRMAEEVLKDKFV